MYYYVEKDKKILGFLELNNEDMVANLPKEFVATERKIIETSYGYIFEDEYDEKKDYIAETEQAKQIKINELKNARDTEELSPISYGGYWWDFDAKAQMRINGAITALGNNTITRTSADNVEVKGITVDDLRDVDGAITVLGNDTITWTSADNEEIKSVTADDLRGVVGAAAIRSNALHIKYRELKAQVEQATTVEEVETIAW